MTLAVSFTVYTLAIVAVGLWSSRSARRSNEDYFLAGRGLGPWVAALSASASSESGWVTLGLVGVGFRSGVSAFWLVPGCLLGYVFNWFFMASRLRARSETLGALTIPDFFAQHFAERKPILRSLTVAVIMIAMWMYVAAQFAAAGKAFHTAFGMPYWIGVLTGTAMVLVYTVIGGFRATCWTDTLQAIFMACALAVFPLFVLSQVGGIDVVREQVGHLNDGAFLSFWPDATGFALIGFLLGSGALGINFGFVGQPHILVRFMAMRDRREAALCGVISIVWGAVVLAGAAAIGILVRAATEGGAEWTAELAAQAAAAPGQAGEVALVVAAQQLVPGVIGGVILSAVLAAMCSTADSQLVVAASAGSNDVYARLIAKDGGTKRGHMIANRLVVFGLGVGAMFLVVDEQVTVYTFVTDYAWAVLGAAIGPQMILALFWKRATYAGCIAGMATGFVVALGWKQLDPILADRAAANGQEWVSIYNLTLAFICAFIVNLAVSFVTSRGRPSSIDA